MMQTELRSQWKQLVGLTNAQLRILPLASFWEALPSLTCEDLCPPSRQLLKMSKSHL
jgi:hypothetical protein